jgi:hypothetical protein
VPIDNTFIASTFRTLGNAAVAQSLFSISNTSGAAKKVLIRRLNVVMDSTAALTGVAVQVRSSRVTGTVPGGGTVLTKTPFDTAKTASIANVVCRGATASDAGGATAITGALGGIMYESMGQRMHTLVGQVLTDIIPAIPQYAATEPIVLNANEALIVAIQAAAAASNPATNHYIVNCTWDEFS